MPMLVTLTQDLNVRTRSQKASTGKQTSKRQMTRTWEAWWTAKRCDSADRLNCPPFSYCCQQPVTSCNMLLCSCSLWQCRLKMVRSLCLQIWPSANGWMTVLRKSFIHACRCTYLAVHQTVHQPYMPWGTLKRGVYIYQVLGRHTLVAYTTKGA